ncbi:THAP domain-containing protein 6-like [Solea solea]|uniref:THAP domain-containing protein 6-like n=1 Tax=Solea solea TaxID=90069 RepID=UPI00272C006A|nr:THAP domain-containing protein 6-like [Solea solea]
MPESCSAWGCTNRRTVQNRSNGVTFHRFPKEKELRRQWEVASRKETCSTSKSAVLCSDHFKPEDFDRTGQVVRIREGAQPSIFSFSTRQKRSGATRTTQTSRKAEESLSVDDFLSVNKTEPLPNADHSYALPASPALVKSRLSKALVRVEHLEREMRNMKDRERRAKIRVHSLLKDLQEKKLVKKDLKDA